MTDMERIERGFNPVAGICAWLWPGLGHIVAGDRRRGGLIMFGILFLVVIGLLVGSFSVVDRQNARLWFYAQSMCGPITFVADFANDRLIRSQPDDEKLHTLSVSRVHELGTLFVALAGLMNLVVILDAVAPIKRPPMTAPPPSRRVSDASSSTSPPRPDSRSSDEGGSP